MMLLCNHWVPGAVARTPIEAALMRVEMRILLLGETGTEPGYEAWQTSLARAGVPFDAAALVHRPSPVRIAGSRGMVRYQALILATGGLIDSSLDGAQRAALDLAERDGGLRRLTAYAYPGREYGLAPPTWAGRLDGITASATERGLEIFPYLRGPVPIDRGTWGYLATPDPDARFQTLLLAPDGSALLGVHCDQDGREEMVQTFDANSSQVHGQLLRQGQLAWLTRGTHLGHQRNYLTLQVDDVLLPNHSWDTDQHASATDGNQILRMTAEDARRTARWSRARGIRLDLACNGAGSRRYARERGVDRDPLLEALLAERDAFGWINHTFEHRNLDEASRATIEREIARNLKWAEEHGLEFDPHALITGEHTGLANLAAAPPRAENRNLAPALTARQIRFLACDASRPYPSGDSASNREVLPAGTPFITGTAFAIPRHPTALAHDVATAEQLLDRLRSTGEAPVESWPQLVCTEAHRILGKVLGNDPRPHYFHQSNLLAHGSDEHGSRSSLLCTLVDAVHSLYQRLILPSMPIAQPTLTEIGTALLRLEAWRQASADGRIRAYLEGTTITIVNRTPTPLELPLTGARNGSDYGGSRSAWVSAPPGTTVCERV
jgi:hypothetical protein